MQPSAIASPPALVSTTIGTSRAAARIRSTVSVPALSGSVRSSRIASKPCASRSIPAPSEPVMVISNAPSLTSSARSANARRRGCPRPAGREADAQWSSACHPDYRRDPCARLISGLGRVCNFSRHRSARAPLTRARSASRSRARRPRTSSGARSARRVRSSSCSSVVISFAPVQPSGWPSAIAPPFTLSFSGSAPESRSHASGTDANASLTS